MGDRHLYAHVCSWEFASALREAKPQFDAAGFKLITIGVGPSSKAQVLAEKVPVRIFDVAESDYLGDSVAFISTKLEF